MESAIKDIELTVEGMTCSNCAMSVTKFLEKRGMKNVYVDFSSGSVKFNANGNYDGNQLSKGIEGLGYHVTTAKDLKEKGAFRWWSTVDGKFYFCLLFTIPLLLHMILPFHLLHHPVVQLMLCLPVYITGLSYFGKSAWGSVKEGFLNMDVLIFIGSTAAFVYSVVGLFILANADYLFFETSASIITLVLLGNLIEKRSIKRTRTAVASLTELQPLKARRIDFYGDDKFEVITEIDRHDIKKGDHFLVSTGDGIPADGTVLWGKGWADESMISGESLPVVKKISDPVITGTLLNEGTLKIRAEAVGKETVLSKIIDLVNDAQRNKPKIQKLADRITSVFVPVVLGISALTFIANYLIFHNSFEQSLMSSIGVLVISCPCAMGLATPTAVMVGIGRAAKKGILIKGAQSLETLASVKTVVFDKTGTLTTGKFRISRITATGVSEEEIKTILASLEKYSSHPIAKSIVEELKDQKTFTVQEVTDRKGLSISAIDLAGNRYEAGSYKIASAITNDRSYNVYVLKNGTLAGMADIQDEIRKEAKAAIKFLKSTGIKAVMLSGDREEICKSVAAAVGIDNYFSEKLPEQKLAIIRDLMLEAPTAMVGDGVNDAPSLTAATIGISLSNATQVAIDAAQIILLQSNLNLLADAIRISKHTLLTIRQNLFWAFFYNIVAIPIAAIGLLKPIVGAASMAFSDVIVIGNSIRLRTKKLS